MAGTAAVNKPTDIKQKEADVNRKLQLYGIINAFQLGKAPSVSMPFGFTYLCPQLLNNSNRRMTKSMSP